MIYHLKCYTILQHLILKWNQLNLLNLLNMSRDQIYIPVFFLFYF